MVRLTASASTSASAPGLSWLPRLSWLPLLVLTACPPPAATPAASAGEQAAAAPADKPATDKPDKPAVNFTTPGSAPVTAVQGGGASPQFRDPAWFRPSLFAGATVIKQGRSPLDDSGFFTSQMTLQLADGTSLEDCVKTLSDAVAADVPGLRREDKDGRATLTGDAAHFTVILICGEAKEHMTSYVSFRWTSAPG